MRLRDQVEMVGEMAARGVVDAVNAVDILVEHAKISRALAAALLLDDAREREAALLLDDGQALARLWPDLGSGRWEAS